MVITRSQARQQVLNKPPSVSDFQGRGSDLPITQEDEQEVTTSTPSHSAVGTRTKGVGRIKGVYPKKTILFSWTPDTLPRRLRRNIVGGREGEKVFLSKPRTSASSTDRTDSEERSKTIREHTQQPTPKFGREMAQFPGADKIRRTPSPSPKLIPQRNTRCPLPRVSEEIVQTIEAESTKGAVLVRTKDTITKDSIPMAQKQPMDPPSWYDRGGILRSNLPASNREGQIGKPSVAKEKIERQEWLRWISWIWEARRQGIEAQLPRIIRNAKDNLDPSIREYDIELSRLIFRAITATALKRLPTEEEMLHEIWEGFIVALQLNDTKYFAAEVRDLHQKIGDPISVRNRMGVQKAVNPASAREFSLEHMTPQEDPPSKELNQLSLEQTSPAPRRSKYFTPEQSEEESDVSVKHQAAARAARALLPRDIPTLGAKEEMKVKSDVIRETKLTNEVVKQRNRQQDKIDKRGRIDFMVILKANAPKKYRGDRNPKVLREWVNQVDHYISMVKLTKRDEMRTILLFLEGDAMLWWRRNRKEFKKKGVASWKTIKRLIVDRFIPLGYRLMLEKQLREVCQRTSAREYASRFTHIIMQLPDYTDKQIIAHFINGLKTKVRTQVISHDPTELVEAIRLAENVDDGLFAEQMAMKKQSVPDPRVTRVTIYKVNQVEGARKSAPPSGGTSIKCYNCGKLGHISQHCRAPRIPQQQAVINES